jgi:hypothetical protein
LSEGRPAKLIVHVEAYRGVLSMMLDMLEGTEKLYRGVEDAPILPPDESPDREPPENHCIPA